VQGTTGYEFGAQLTELLINREAERVFDRIYEKFTGQTLRYGEVVYQGKLLTMRAMMASDINALGAMLNRLSETHRWYRDFTLNALTAAVREVIACFPVYRTYLRPGNEPGPEDTRVIHRAIRAARRRNPALERTVFEFVRDVLIPPRGNPHPVNEADRRAFVAKFQQCTGAISAKGVEDTAFYVYNRLAALNEVGGDPSIFGQPLERFHEFNKERLRTFPHGLLATSTHDSKRSEDVRARLAALSELAPEWSRALRHWRSLNAGHRTALGEESAPDANEEYLLYQTLLGTWPLAQLPAADYGQYIHRIQAYMRKALAEAKVNSSWIEPNEEWEAATDRFIEKAMEPVPSNRFLTAFKPLADQVAQLGCVNSLSQTVLKLTCPGVPDFYQGQELWDLSLVDPDNRRPVDYKTRRELLQSVQSGADPEALLRHWRDGRIKLWITHRLLQTRREFPDLFAHGTYEPIVAQGTFGTSCVGFERRTESHRLLVVAPRLTARIGFPPTGAAWADTWIASPGAQTWQNLLTASPFQSSGAHIPLKLLLERFPIAVLVGSNEPKKTG
jgi:(1->4)-alpha-D-glucan 1-alpha-D-glucosylmutase